MAEILPAATPNPPILSATANSTDEVEARRLAERYELEFVDLEHFHIDHGLFRSIPAGLPWVIELAGIHCCVTPMP